MNYTQLSRMPEDLVLVYKIENLVNGNAYVGSTKEPKRRWRSHKQMLRCGVHTSPFLQKAWAKYGEQSFVYKALLVCSSSNRHVYEDIAIDADGYYNLLKASGLPMPGAMRGRVHKAETKALMSKNASALWETRRSEKYDPLCEKAWLLVVGGLPRYKACEQVGVSQDYFWKWLAKNGKMQGVRGAFKRPVA